MDVTYKPEQGAGGNWKFDWRKVDQQSAELIEKRSGMSWEEWLSGVRFGNSKARKVLLWHLMAREHPTFRWDDVPNYYMGELTVEMELPELRDLRDTIATATGVPAEIKEAALVALDEQIEAMTSAPIPGQVVDEGKARSRNSASATPSPSPSASASGLGSNASS